MSFGGSPHNQWSTTMEHHLAPLLLTNLLLDRLELYAPVHVISVASNAHATGRIDFDDLQGELPYSGGRAYGQSKFANVLFTHQLARRMRESAVTANALQPGSADILRSGGPRASPERLLNDQAVAARLWKASGDLAGLIAAPRV
jgi:retinol dehydrogenase 14